MFLKTGYDAVFKNLSNFSMDNFEKSFNLKMLKVKLILADDC